LNLPPPHSKPISAKSLTREYQSGETEQVVQVTGPLRIWAKSILASHCFLLGLACAGAAEACTDRAAADAVTFEEIRIPYGDQPALAGGVWRPALSQGNATPSEIHAEGNGLPLVVISHGGGGSYDGHIDTATSLACAGFVVAAVSHSGDTYDDQSRVLELWRRPDQLRRLIGFMLTDWHHDRIDARRVGAFGFSNGAFTVLVAAGGIPDLNQTEQYCGSHPDHDLCRALSEAGISPRLGMRVPVDAWIQDSRIRAIVVAAPAFGFAFRKEGLREVKIPVQIWGGALDRHQPAPWYEDAVAADLPVAPDVHRIPGAGHYDFLPPCSASLIQVAPAICTSEAGFDRAGFHRKLNENIVAFLSRNLAFEAPEAVQAHGRPEGNVAIRPPVVNVKGPKR
jgi:predicted dienelactone hydrolase